MTTKVLALGTATLTFGLLFGIRSVGHAAPVQAQPAPVKVTPKPAGIKRVSKLTTQATAAVPGETRNVKAVLMSGTTPLAGKNVVFKFEGRQPNGQNVSFAIGQDVTNASGEASLGWKVPEIAQGAYNLKASFAGDDDTGASNDEANFGIIKGITKFDLGDITYGALDSHGGPKYHTVMIRLRRQSDNEALNKTVKIRVNGGPEQTVNLGQYNAAMSTLLLQPTNATQWTVKATFLGDDANQAVETQRTYNRTPGT